MLCQLQTFEQCLSEEVLGQAFFFLDGHPRSLESLDRKLRLVFWLLGLLCI
ncbi:unnamed protein product, partial [marine sediment metagenome]